MKPPKWPSLKSRGSKTAYKAVLCVVLAISQPGWAADEFSVDDAELNSVTNPDPAGSKSKKKTPPAKAAKANDAETNADEYISNYTPQSEEKKPAGDETNRFLDEATGAPDDSSAKSDKLNFGEDEAKPAPTSSAQPAAKAVAPAAPVAAATPVPSPTQVPAAVLPGPPPQPAAPASEIAQPASPTVPESGQQVAIPVPSVQTPAVASKPVEKSAPVVPAVAAPQTPTSVADPVLPAPEEEPIDELVGSPKPDKGPIAKPIPGGNEFAGAPPVPDSRRLMADGEAPEEYAVEGGDTLYDICDQLIDEPGYWPKLWALNPEIKNPHFIYPGMKLRFYPGDNSTPPFLQVVSEDDIIPVEKDTGAAALSDKDLVSGDLSKVLLDPGVLDVVEVVDPKGLESTTTMEDVFEFAGKVANTDKIMLTIPAFVFGDEKDELGEVIAGISGKLLVDRPEEIIIEVTDRMDVGSTYTVLRPGETVREEDSGDYVGVRYDFVAHVRIKRRIDGDYMSAVVTENRLGVEQGDIIVPYLSTTRSISVGENRPGSGVNSGAVVGFEYPYKQIGGKGSFVLLSNNSERKLSAGENVTVYQHVNRNASVFVIDDLPNTKKAVAIVKIIDATGAAAIGYVLSNIQEIRLGDTAGAGAG